MRRPTPLRPRALRRRGRGLTPPPAALARDRTDWICSCYAHNFASREECYKCGKKKADVSAGAGAGDAAPRKRAVRVGDWYCSSCAAHNFASRDACFKCGHAKSDGGKVVTEENMEELEKEHDGGAPIADALIEDTERADD